MCGIAGYWTFSSNHKEELQNDLPEAIKRIHHRGRPDDSGIWFNEEKNLGLGHARLAILDLSQHAHQPMLSIDGRYVLVFNGEIYNFKEIRKNLEKKGYQFKGSGDTEVVLYAFAEWGKDCVQQFIGMFAFAIWDKKEQTLFLCRDRVGVKPLYYAWHNKVFCFASELKAVRAFKHWNTAMNRQALGEYFQYGYIAAPRSIYHNVYKLTPGHWLELKSESEPKIEPYWSILNSVEKGELLGTEEELSEQLEDLLIDAFKYRMVSDVPVGVFLSGGIDSSIVAAILQKHSTQQIHTFTIGFKEDSHDESQWAKKVANHLGTKHTEYILEIDKAKEIILKLPEIYDEPFGDSSGIPTYMVSQLARQDIKVALSADGGDELFGGYSTYSLMPHRLNKLLQLPYFLRKLIISGVNILPQKFYNLYLKNNLYHNVHLSKWLERIEKIRSIMPAVKSEDVFDMALSKYLEPQIQRLLGNYENPRNKANIYKGQFQEQMMLWDFHHYLPEDILTKVDRATMAVGLEGREPFLDHRLIEFAFRLPLKYRIGTLGGKHLLRKVLYKYVPRQLIDRPKQGFAIPLDEWLRKDLSYLLDDYLNRDALNKMGLLNPNEVIMLVKAFKTGTGISGTKIWLLLMFAMWFEVHKF